MPTLFLLTANIPAHILGVTHMVMDIMDTITTGMPQLDTVHFPACRRISFEIDRLVVTWVLLMSAVLLVLLFIATTEYSEPANINYNLLTAQQIDRHAPTTGLDFSTAHSFQAAAKVVAGAAAGFSHQ
ncbi:hypothetical protein FGIG_05118 [Fasciola gigantica]|uniref:Uncharacterized protein n=1 Tax=Fasciola gigantica TaxID=46835 RepID=A0A504Y5U5_FASGI|nr:hypothetical protein FGIG_05118 [Fasciola gigantica]